MLTVFLAGERLSGGVGSGISVSAKGRASQLNCVSCSWSMDCTRIAVNQHHNEYMLFTERQETVTIEKKRSIFLAGDLPFCVCNYFRRIEILN